MMQRMRGCALGWISQWVVDSCVATNRGVEVRGAHASKIAKHGAASAMVLAARLGQPRMRKSEGIFLTLKMRPPA